MARRTIGITSIAALLLAACSGGDDAAPSATSTTTTMTAPDTTAPTDAPETTEPPEPETAVFAAADFVVRPGTEQLTITGADAGRTLTVYDADGTDVASGTVDTEGALIFRHLDGGATYTVGDDAIHSEPTTTLDRDEHPARAFYAEQRLPTDGLGYVTTRDGTTLSASVWLPGPVEDGPYPTVVEYSGYSPSDPDAAGFPDVFTALGYAYVGVNIRGTGCSGGSFRYFEYAQSLDGYDAIETVAAQPWVQGNRVGMVGVSYPGISQLFVGQTQPPGLAAITPFSVLADSAISTLYPGGILNTGFAVPWTEERLREAEAEGQQWAADRIAAGDDVCDANQDLRLQNPDLLAEITANQYWTDEVAGEISPRLFVDRITVPTFVAGAWQDEQTGGHFATMLDRFTGTEHLYATMMNGLHTESIGPAVFPRLVEFLDLYVAERTPSLAVARSVAPLLAQQIFETTDVDLPPDDRFAGMNHAEALAAFEAEPPIRVLFEQGAAEGRGPRTPLPRFEAAFDAWPVPDAAVRAWYLTEDGSLDDNAEPDDGESSYLALPDATPATWFDEASGNIWSVDVTYDWPEGGPGTFADWLTPPLTDDTVVVGSGSVDLWMGSDFLSGPAGDTDVEVTITEVRPDGQEVYIQSGWQRASQRALDESASTDLRPVHTHREVDAEPMPDGEFALVRVELFPFAHAFRAGSRIRLIVDAPGGQRPIWEFNTLSGGEEITIAHGGEFPSRVVLPVVDGVDVPAAYPPCDVLRGQPCRPFAG
ncbi:MAG: CocE/NonD family hydrolase [Ilumatobacteraceae bacterium]|nr:CocE/NonD family hydrolase [Ilumatobacteraceae bacterium]